ncbi:MAG: hypothetical protein JWQ29_1390, partial [Phenylobacterium sp.]|nr:hypothetical protein [Phenylobacterium sp.]
MAKTRTKSRRRHVKRLLPGVLATFVAASAMAFGSASGPPDHQDEAPQEIRMAMAVNPPSDETADETAPAQQDDAAPGGGAAPPAPQDETPGGAPGPQAGLGGGDGGFGDPDGFLPNGEDGLMLLADYAQSKGGDAAPGDVPGAGEGPTDGSGLGDGGAQIAEGGAPGDSFETEQNDSGGGLGFMGGGGGSGGGGGGGAGGGGGGGG